MTPRPEVIAGIPPRLLTTQEVAELLRLHPKTVARHCKFSGLPFLRVGGRVRFDPTQVTRWLNVRKGDRT